MIRKLIFVFRFFADINNPNNDKEIVVKRILEDIKKESKHNTELEEEKIPFGSMIEGKFLKDIDKTKSVNDEDIKDEINKSPDISNIKDNTKNDKNEKESIEKESSLNSKEAKEETKVNMRIELKTTPKSVRKRLATTPTMVRGSPMQFAKSHRKINKRNSDIESPNNIRSKRQSGLCKTPEDWIELDRKSVV